MLEKKNNSEIYLGLLSVLAVNAIVVYGVLFLKWNFFMVIYSYWFAEFISSLFDKLKYRTLKKRNEIHAAGVKKESEGRFLFLFVYWVFIVLIAGFIAAPENTFGENIMVVLFMNKAFNINLLCIVLGEFALYYQRFVLHRNYDPEVVARKNTLMNKRTMVMHISIIAGAFVWFAMHFEGFFIHINPGKYGDYAFMLVFVGIRVVGELIGINVLFREGKNKSSGEDFSEL